MHKILSALILILIGNCALAQVSQLNSNQSLQIQFTLNDTKGLLVSETDSTLWVTDGTSSGTIQLSPTIFFRASGGLLNGKFFFAATSVATGTELYSTDGTIAGTTLVKDIYPGPTGSFPHQNFALLNGYLYFSAITPTEGRELWRTDGTLLGTTLVKDINPGSGSSNTGTGFNIYSNGSFLLFGAADTPGNVELWKSDGTPTGTILLKDINTFAGMGSKPDYFNNLGTTTLFMANDSTHGAEIWLTDGTTNGTMLLKDINPGMQSSINYAFFRKVNNKYFFTADNGTNGDELWSTDGTPANTMLIKDIFPGSTGSYATMYNSITVGNKVIFTAADLLSGYELWESDGTAAGTKVLKDIDFGSNSSFPTLMLAYEFDYNTSTVNNPLFQGNKFFFQATTAANGTELWVSDGTPTGTKIVKDLNVAAANGLVNPTYTYTTNDFYFSADNGIQGVELWKTNGTSLGTSRVSDIVPGIGSSEVALGMVVNNKLIFEATNGDAVNRDLYRLDSNVTLLPIALIDFTARKNKNDIILDWSTSCEINSRNFTLQRSVQGDQFTDIGIVNGAGNSCIRKTYTLTDEGILNKRNTRIYYRLAMTDVDGKTMYSKTISVQQNTTANWNVRLIQNPVLNDLKLLLTDANDKVTFYVKDINGNQINLVKTAAGNGQTTLTVSSLLPGMYVLVAESGNEKKTIRFVKF